jgi:hypothetical protein
VSFQVESGAGDRTRSDKPPTFLRRMNRGVFDTL